MKIMTVLGTRPELIRLSRIIPLLDRLCDHVLVHTGQNYDRLLNEIFHEQLGIRPPDEILGCRAETPMALVGSILAETERVFAKHRPDRLLILGDTNSGLAAYAAKRMGIPVFHMEAGNRCYDDRVPEEVNRRVIDHASDVLMPYTERSRANLLREGIAGERIFVTGNPIREVIDHYEPQIAASAMPKALGLDKQGYFLVTLHRAENVDVPQRLAKFIEALHQIHAEHGKPVICSVHPRMRSQLQRQGVQLEGAGVRGIDALGFFDFIALERNAYGVLTDSGTVQEECCIFRVPNVTLRDVTERPETIEVGSNILSGAEPAVISAAVGAALGQAPAWTPPPQYMAANVSGTVAKILLGYHGR